MEGDEHPTKVALRGAREQVLERLSDGFARDELGLDEFERRVDGAYRAASIEELTPLVGDLAPRAAPLAVVQPHGQALAPSAQAAPRRAMAILGSIERSGRFRLTDGMRATAVFGNVELDLRDVELGPGVTHLHVKAVFGNVELTVPPTLAVECEGSSVLGNFETVNRVPPEGASGPLLRIIGSVVFGNVEVHTRPRR